MTYDFRDKKAGWVLLSCMFMCLLIVVRNIFFRGMNTSFLWICDLLPFLLVFSILIKDNQLVKAIINCSLLLQLIYDIDVFFFLISGKTISLLPGITLGIIGRELMQTQRLFNILVGIIIHFFPVIFALILTYKEKPKTLSLIYSAIIVIIVDILSLLFTNPSINVNFVLRIALPIPYYSVLWTLLVFILIVLPTQGIQYLIWKISSKKRR